MSQVMQPRSMACSPIMFEMLRSRCSASPEQLVRASFRPRDVGRVVEFLELVSGRVENVAAFDELTLDEQREDVGFAVSGFGECPVVCEDSWVVTEAHRAGVVDDERD